MGELVNGGYISDYLPMPWISSTDYIHHFYYCNRNSDHPYCTADDNPKTYSIHTFFDNKSPLGISGNVCFTSGGVYISGYKCIQN